MVMNSNDGLHGICLAYTLSVLCHRMSTGVFFQCTFPQCIFQEHWHRKHEAVVDASPLTAKDCQCGRAWILGSIDWINCLICCSHQFSHWKCCNFRKAWGAPFGIMHCSLRYLRQQGYDTQKTRADFQRGSAVKLQPSCLGFVLRHWIAHRHIISVRYPY